MIITERLEPDRFGADPNSWTDWGVVAERVLDSNGTHSWSLVSSDISLDAHWLPIELYRFEGSSFSMDFAAGRPAGATATPESSTWTMMLIGFAALCLAGYRNSKISGFQSSSSMDCISDGWPTTTKISSSAPPPAPIWNRHSNVPKAGVTK